MLSVLLPTVDYVPQRGGVARYLEAIKKTFPQDIDVLYWNKPIGKFSMLRQLHRETKRHRQIWTSHILPIGTLCYLLEKWNGTPYVIFLHGTDFDLARRNIWKRFLAKKILKSAKRVVTNTQALANEVKEFASVDNPLVVYPAVQDELMQLGVTESRDNLDHSIVVLLTVSRLVERKGHERVLKQLIGFPDIEYKIIGDGPQKKYLQDLVIALGLSDRVEIISDADDDDLVQHYKRADIFVMPTTKLRTDREGFGIVYIEAQYFGLPVIASISPGVNEAVVDGKTAFLISSDDELRTAMERLISDVGLRRKMGQDGKTFVSSKFGREKSFKRLETLI